MEDLHPEAMEIFTWNTLRIEQSPDVFRIGTDAVLLGGWVSRMNVSPGHILDAGTGTGILAARMAECFPNAFVEAIDINPNAIRLAERNVQQASHPGRFAISLENILEQPEGKLGRYDLILCNPPFYRNHVLPVSAFRAQTRHSDCSVAEWVSGLTYRLAVEGSVCLVVPSSSAQEWISAMNREHLFCTERMDMYSFYGDPLPARSLLRFNGVLSQPKMYRCTIYTRDHVYTEEYLQWTGLSPKSGGKTVHGNSA